MRTKLYSVALFVALTFPTYGQVQELKPVEPVFNHFTDVSQGNFNSFSKKIKQVSNFWKSNNAAFINHPDAGYIPKEQPDGNVIEIIGKRTETSRYYIDQDTPGKIFSQGAYGALHYKKQGQWLIIDSRLEDLGQGILQATHQPEPVGFQIPAKRSYLLTTAGKVSFNDWKLYGISGKKSIRIGEANWDDYSAGDDGVYIRNIFPGIDAEMRVMRGRIKTNLIVRQWKFGGFSHFFFADNFGSTQKGNLAFVDQQGIGPANGEIDYKIGTKLLARIGRAVAYSENDPENVAYLSYSIQSEQLRIHISKSEVDQILKKGPLVIDPLVTGPELVYKPAGILNSYNNEDCSFDFNKGCSYSWMVPIPAMVTVTNGYFNFMFQTFAPCTRDKFRIKYGIGDNLCGQGLSWETTGLPPTPGSTGGNLSEYAGYSNCIKSGCELTYVKVTLSTLRACMGPAGCESSCVQGIGPFVTTFEGRTLEMISTIASPSVLQCALDTVQLSALADYGIKPYTYEWTPGNLKGNDIFVNPAQSMTYQVTVKDACNQVVSGKVNVVAPPVAPSMTASISASQNQICFGEEVTFMSNVQNVENPNYQWIINGTYQPGATGDKFTSVLLENGDQVTLEITNPEQCAYQKIFSTPPITVAVYPNKLYDQPVMLQDCESVVYEGKTFTADTTFKQILRDRYGCDSVNRIVQVIIKPFKVNLSADYRSPLFYEDPVILMASSNEAEFEITAWSPRHLFLDQHGIEQKFNIDATDTLFSVFARNSSGCRDSASVFLHVLPKPFGNLLPNVFTPDGDGINDLWAPLKKKQFPVGELFVYDRWGECIYHAEDYTVGWDGIYKGSLVPVGVYAFRLIIDKSFEMKGSVTILY